MSTSTHPRVTVYGADWCHVTSDTREFLDELGVQYRYVNTDTDPAASQWVKDHNNGLEIKPTLDIDGQILTAPAADVLEAALRDKQVLRAA